MKQKVTIWILLATASMFVGSTINWKLDLAFDFYSSLGGAIVPFTGTVILTTVIELIRTVIRMKEGYRFNDFHDTLRNMAIPIHAIVLFANLFC